MLICSLTHVILSLSLLPASASLNRTHSHSPSKNGSSSSRLSFFFEVSLLDAMTSEEMADPSSDCQEVAVVLVTVVPRSPPADGEERVKEYEWRRRDFLVRTRG